MYIVSGENLLMELSNPETLNHLQGSINLYWSCSKLFYGWN